MTTSIVFSFIGADKPGLVEQLSNTVSEYGGNWLESRMSQLAGYFTGIVRVQVVSSQHEALCQALQTLSSSELTVSIQQDNSSDSQPQRLLKLNLLGNDRPGIILELSSALAALHINVCEMDTNVTSAPMTAEPLFEAIAEIQVPAELDMHSLHERLEEIANELSVDINLEE